MQTLSEEETTILSPLPIKALDAPQQRQAGPRSAPLQLTKPRDRRHLLRKRGQAVRGGLALLLQTSAIGFAGLALLCAAFLIVFLGGFAWMCLTPSHEPGPDAPAGIIALRVSLLSLALSGVACLLYKLAASANKRATTLHNVLLTGANTGDLPVQESLVRASEQPVLPPQYVLLRPAVEMSERHEEQLLRPS